MAVCEFHREYEQYLIDRVASGLVGPRPKNLHDWTEVWPIVENIIICKQVENITGVEADNLILVVFKIYPQFEPDIKAKLMEKFGATL